MMTGILRSLSILIMLLFMAGSASASGGLDFFREEITLTADDTIAQIEGIYYFRNTVGTSGIYPVAFPFFVDSETGFPHSVSATLLDGADTSSIELELMPKSNSALIRVPLDGDSVTIWRISYSQSLSGNHARYVLTTTSAWGKPLEEAHYRFIISPELIDVKFWPEPQSFEIDGDRLIYSVEKYNFMPLNDMEISWKKR